jgi:hypothetical protein
MNRMGQSEWRERIRAALSTAGFATATEYLRQSPTTPYVEAAKRLQCSAADLWTLQTEEAKAQGALRSVATDALVRILNGNLPGGWGVGMNFEFRRASAWGEWASLMKLDLNEQTLLQAKRVWDRLNELSPPQGWKPQSTRDSFICEAFDNEWKDA